MKIKNSRLPSHPCPSVRFRHEGLIISPDDRISGSFENGILMPYPVNLFIMFIASNLYDFSFFRYKHHLPHFHFRETALFPDTLPYTVSSQLASHSPLSI